MMEYKDLKNFVIKDIDPAKHRHPGGPRKYIVRGEKTSRRIWQKVGGSNKPSARYLVELTPLEKIISDMQENDFAYTELAPTQSSFALVEEAVCLYKGDPRDERYTIYGNVKVPFADVNAVGMSRSGVGRTLRRPYHGWGCTCYECDGYPEDKA
jgi:hypothetical protein